MEIGRQIRKYRKRAGALSKRLPERFTFPDRSVSDIRSLKQGELII